MARRLIFHSFRHSYDWWRVQTLRQIGAIEGQPLLSSNDWEAVQRKGERAIRAWIDEQMRGRSCVVVFIGSATAGRKWVNYEMKKRLERRQGRRGHLHTPAQELEGKAEREGC